MSDQPRVKTSANRCGETLPTTEYGTIRCKKPKGHEDLHAGGPEEWGDQRRQLVSLLWTHACAASAADIGGWGDVDEAKRRILELWDDAHGDDDV